MTKLANLTAGSNENPIHAQVEVDENATLTPALARSVAQTAYGHTNGVTVELSGLRYRLSGGRARKLPAQYE